MNVIKIKSFSIEKGYSVSVIKINGTNMLAVGTEGPGKGYLLSLPDFQPEELCAGPGGTMSILNVPGDKSNDLVSIMGLFPPFVGFEAGVYYHLWSEDGWCESKIIDLPFSHRMEWMDADGVATLLVACVSKHKEDPSDWSQPGILYAATLDSYDQKWQLTPVINALTRNHGLLKTIHNGVESLLVSGAEGVFRVFWDSEQKRWASEKWLDREVSEIAKIDLDGDGLDELITIEPFHGNKLVVYKIVNGKWEKKFDADLSFGHGLCADTINGQPTILVGNRASGKELLVFRPIDLEAGQMQRIVIDPNAGPTQTISITIDGKAHIISSNQNQGEISLYQVYN